MSTTDIAFRRYELTRQDDACEFCTEWGVGTCPECFKETGEGCAHGPLCEVHAGSQPCQWDEQNACTNEGRSFFVRCTGGATGDSYLCAAHLLEHMQHGDEGVPCEVCSFCSDCLAPTWPMKSNGLFGYS